MYKKERVIPDVGNIEGGFFNIFDSRNVVVSDNKPTLVDTSFGRIQRSRSLGGLWSYLISRGVKRGMDDILEGKLGSAGELWLPPEPVGFQEINS